MLDLILTIAFCKFILTVIFFHYSEISTTAASYRSCSIKLNFERRNNILLLGLECYKEKGLTIKTCIPFVVRQQGLLNMKTVLFFLSKGCYHH